MLISSTLAELRKKAKLTQSELGEKLSISAQAISKWENGTSEPDIATLKKLADIYGVTISHIVDPEHAKKSEDEGGCSQDKATHGSIFDLLYDVYLVETNPNNKTKTINYIANMLGISYLDAMDAVENLPYCISGKMDAETGNRIADYLSEVGATVSLENCTGANSRRNIVSLKTPDIPEPSAPTQNMRKRFIIANITAGLPAIAVLIISLLMGGGFGDAMLSIYAAACTYSLIFLLWYPTLVRKLLSPMSLSDDGILDCIGSFIKCFILIPWLIIVGLISPIIYVFSIKTRIQRMRNEDDQDDIFMDDFFKENTLV